MKKLLVLLYCISAALLLSGQASTDFAALKDRVKMIPRQTNADELFALEKDYDAFYANQQNWTPEVQFYYAELKLYIGHQYVRQKNYMEAERTLLNTISLSQYFEKFLLQAYSELFRCYSGWALEKESYNNYTDAIHYSLLAIDCAKKAYKEEQIMKQYIILGYEYAEVDDLEKAENCYHEAEMLAAERDDNAKYEAAVLYGRSKLAKSRGNYKDAITMLETAYDIYNQSKIINKQEDMIIIGISLRDLYRFQLHNKEKADQWDQVVSSLKDSSIIDTDGDTDIMSVLLRVHKLWAVGKYQDAIMHYQSIIQSLIGAPSPDNKYVLMECYFYSGISHMRLNEYDAAISDLRNAIYYANSGGQAKDLIDCYTHLSHAYYYKDNMTESVEAAKQAVAVAESIFDSDSKQLGDCYNNLANLYAFQGDENNAKKYLMKAADINVQDVRNTFSYLTSQERNSYWNTAQKDIINIQPFMLKFNERQSQYTDALYDVQLLSKGLLLQSDIELQILALTSPRYQSLFAEIIQIKKTLMRGDISMDSVRLLKQQAEKIEQELTVNSSEVGDFLHFLNIRSTDVKEQLGSNRIAIEFATFRYGKDSLMTVAYMMKAGWEHVMLIPLYEERSVKPLANTTSDNQINISYDYNSNGKILTKLVWQKLLPYLSVDDTIYFAPSGLLYQIPIENLPYDSIRSMSDVYNLVRLSSTRELVLRKTRNEQNTQASLYGGIKYDVDIDDMLAQKEENIDIEEPESPTQSFYAQNKSSQYETNNMVFTNLAGTLEEVREVADIMRQQNIYVHPFTYRAANEESFKAISGKKQNIIFISTHGFYWPDTIAQRLSYFKRRLQIGGDNPNAYIDPLDRCGLAFAGANNVMRGESIPEGIEDGILLAKEISLMDLREAHLVVLSACETGMGDVNGDGVFGLQRAFKMAGAETIIMSLWSVNNASTRMLMTEFFRNWLENGQPKRDAFYNAQASVRSQYHSPYYWAGFVMLD